MFQDIDPHKLTYESGRDGPRDEDHVLVLKDGRVLLEACQGELALPAYGEAREALQNHAGGLVYLFSAGGTDFYHSLEPVDAWGRFVYDKISVVRGLKPPHLAFAAATAFHIASWYGDNRYCGKCSSPMLPDKTERALHCPVCDLVKYPRVSPMIMVGVVDGEKLLLTRYSGREYTGYALIAGYVEPGETLEGAIAREVMEEVGLRVTNVRYFKSQPWAFSQSLLMGFFADLEGDGTITLDTGELSEAGWFPRAEIPEGESRFSLTWDMIHAFRDGEA